MNIRLKRVVVWFGVSAAVILAVALVGCPSQSDKALRAHFVAHRADFEKLVAMANEDNHLTRIAPDFTWLDDDVGWPRKNVGISEERWNDYRQMFQKVGVPDGIIRRTSPAQIMIPIVSAGLVPTGFIKGLAYSQEPLRPVLQSLDGKFPQSLWDGPGRSHVLAYKPIEDHWYIYYEQW